MDCFTSNGDFLYKRKEDCYGCGTCVASCSKEAITMEEDEYGFRYPVINPNKCIGCGLCIKNCIQENNLKNNLKRCYAGTNKDRQQSKSSASAGIFSGIADIFLKNGGLVCGAVMKINNGVTIVEHQLITHIDDLYQLQGSKYVQSNLTHCLPEMESELKKGKLILFSGTPCQVAGIKSLFRKYNLQLYTIDVICHGVPNEQFFNNYLKTIQKKSGFEIKKFCFRNKKYGWGHYGSISGVDREGYNKEIKITPSNSSYYKFFFDSEIYRESCYSCQFACLERVGDISIGDYWGIENYDSGLLEENGGPFSTADGVSSVMLNTFRGEELLKKFGSKLMLCETDIENMVIVNSQLRQPAVHSNLRYKILETYKEKGYSAVERLFYRRKRFNYCIGICKRCIPKSIKSTLKKILQGD